MLTDALTDAEGRPRMAVMIPVVLAMVAIARVIVFLVGMVLGPVFVELAQSALLGMALGWGGSNAYWKRYYQRLAYRRLGDDA